MEVLDRILDLPVIVQGALGSFLFWLAYVVSQKLINLIAKIVGSYSKRIQRENILFEKMHLLQDVFPVSDPKGTLAHVLGIQAALYKLIKGMIFICFGLVSEKLIGSLSIIAYLIAVYYLFRSLKAGFVSFEPSEKSVEEKNKRIKELSVQKDQLGK